MCINTRDAIRQVRLTDFDDAPRHGKGASGAVIVAIGDADVGARGQGLKEQDAKGEVEKAVTEDGCGVCSETATACAEDGAADGKIVVGEDGGAATEGCVGGEVFRDEVVGKEEGGGWRIRGGFVDADVAVVFVVDGDGER